MRPRNLKNSFPSHGAYGIEYHSGGFVIVKSLSDEYASSDEEAGINF